MRVACVLRAHELNVKPADLVVLPEGVCWKEIYEAESYNPNAVIVAAVEEHGYCRGILQHRGQNQIDYLKVGFDGRIKGSGNNQQNPIYEFGDICIGVLICMDIDEDLSRTVVEKIQASLAKSKYLCVPADMGSEWFRDDSLPYPKQFEGIHVILCNHVKYHQVRCKSFMTDTIGKKVVVQKEHEPIFEELS